MGFLKRREVVFALRLIVGGIFIVAAYEKVIHPQQFGISVRGYQLIPISLSNLFALAVSWSELVAGVLLVLGVFTRKAAGAILLLLIMFTVAVTTVLVRGMAVDCGCFGPEGSSQTGPLLIVRNLVLITATLIVMRFDKGFFSLARSPRRENAESATS